MAYRVLVLEIKMHRAHPEMDGSSPGIHLSYLALSFLYRLASVVIARCWWGLIRLKVTAQRWAIVSVGGTGLDVKCRGRWSDFEYRAWPVGQKKRYSHTK
jgi:hypothetical protein